jgi:Spy/CpxP family protein refolding chaperone
MRKNHWKAVAVAAVFLMTVPALLALAADKTTKTAKPAAKTTEQAMPGCTMHGGADKDMPACSMKGGMGKEGCCKSGDMKGCSMKGGMGKDGCCKSGEMKGCSMKGAMGQGAAACCKSGDMKGCGMKGGTSMAVCVVPGGKGMAGCGMKGGMGKGMAGGPMCGPGMGPGMGAGHGAMMLHGLDLTPEQQKKVAVIHERAQRQMIQQQADVRIATMDLQQLMRAETPDKAKIDAQIDKVAQLRAGMQKSHTATLLEVRALLTPEQLKKFQPLPMGGEEDD